MRKYQALSAIALLTTAISALPAHALSLNLGGNGPLIDLGNDNNADATVSVDTGNLLGGGSSGGGGSDGSGGADANAAIDLNLGSIGGDGDGGLLGGNGLIDLGGDNDNDAVIDLDGDLLDLGGNGGLLDLGGDGDLIDLAGLNLGDGSLLDLSGNDDIDAAIEVDLGDGDLLDLGSTGGIGDTGGLLDLGSQGDLLDLGTGDLLDLGGNGDLLDLGGGNQQLLALDLDGTNIDADLNLAGDDEPIVDVTITNDEGGLAGTGVLPNTETEATVGGGNAATVTITDTSDDDDDGNGGGGDDDGNGNGGGGNGGGSGNGNGGNGNGSGVGGVANGGDGGVFADAGAACLTLTSAQVDELIRRHTYNRATFNSWASAQSLRVVEVDLCEGEIAEVAAAAGADANVARLQAFLAAQAKVRAGLQSKGHAPGDVIAADHSGEILTVYVI